MTARPMVVWVCPLIDPGGPLREGQGRTPEMHGIGSQTAPYYQRSRRTRPGTGCGGGGGKGAARGERGQRNTSRTQRRARRVQRSGSCTPSSIEGQHSTLHRALHHLTIDRLRSAYEALSRTAAAGVDGVTWQSYGQQLEANLRDLHARLHRGAFREKPSRGVVISKADGRPRPLGIAALEDKIVQRAVVEILNSIYEHDFLGFSYGFRPGRSQHNALDALATGILRRKVSWVLDADIRDCSGSLDRSWLLKFLEHRIADKRILRLIQKWLNAGSSRTGPGHPRPGEGPTRRLMFS